MQTLSGKQHLNELLLHFRMERGKQHSSEFLLHFPMEGFWQQIVSQETLLFLHQSAN